MVNGVRAAGIGRTAPAREGAKPATESFSVGDGAAPVANPVRLSSVSGIGMESLLTLQGIDEPTERDRAARKRGNAMLALLTKLQHAMLAGEDPAAALRALNDLSADEAVAADAELGAILRAVVLRSRVEIARRELGRG